jgi:hypothetical protein
VGSLPKETATPHPHPTPSDNGKIRTVPGARVTLTPVRGIVDNHVGGLKTVSSAAAVPASQEVTDVLARWHERTLCAEPTDWVFSSPKMGGEATILAGFAHA